MPTGILRRRHAPPHEKLGSSYRRLPEAKELQSLVDSSRSPDTSASAAIDPVFSTTAIVNEGGVTAPT
jgi:hypothetical protein